MTTTATQTNDAKNRPAPAKAAPAELSGAAVSGDAVPDACDVFEVHAGPVELARARLVPEATAAALAETFRVLGDPTRVRILDAISSAELCVCDIAELVGQSESAVSHQLRLLRGMRLVRARRSGRQVFYALDDHHITDLFVQGLRHVEEAAGKDRRPR